MTESTSIKEGIFWIVFIMAVIIIGWYLLDLIKKSETNPADYVFTKTIISEEITE